jgi:cell division GTPase FtsZ
MSIADAEKVVEITSAKINPGARIIWGATVDPTLEHEIRVMLVITGVKSRLLDEHLGVPQGGAVASAHYKQVQGRSDMGGRGRGGSVELDFVK